MPDPKEAPLLAAAAAVVADADDTGCDGCAVISKSVLRRLERQVQRQGQEGKSTQALSDVRIGLTDGSFLHFTEAQLTHVPSCDDPHYVVVANKLCALRLNYRDIDYICPDWQKRAPETRP